MSLPPPSGSDPYSGPGISRVSEIPLVWCGAILCLCSVRLDNTRSIPPQGMDSGQCYRAYHDAFLLQFESFNDSIETLFSLLNGDDIYNTYIGIEPQVDLAAYVYSRFFLYIFLGLFVYAVLNLFTSLIISAHEISQVWLGMQCAINRHYVVIILNIEQGHRYRE